MRKSNTSPLYRPFNNYVFPGYYDIVIYCREIDYSDCPYSLKYDVADWDAPLMIYNWKKWKHLLSSDYKIKKKRISNINIVKRYAYVLHES
jgi:hypothetical protein